MSGFHETVWVKSPSSKSPTSRRVWLSVRRITGSPPTMLEYKPPWNWDNSGDQPIFRRKAEWVIHHKRGVFRFTGAAKVVIRKIEATGLFEAIDSIGNKQGEGNDGRNTNG